RREHGSRQRSKLQGQEDWKDCSMVEENIMQDAPGRQARKRKASGPLDATHIQYGNRASQDGPRDRAGPAPLKRDMFHAGTTGDEPERGLPA
ncbi:hypothetical protein LTR28_001947, partial [Elasticomyces elasticus]